MSTLERALGGAEIEVAAKATRRRFTLDYKRKIVREADGCKTPGAVGALLRREAGPAVKRRGPVPRVPDPRDKRIAELERANTFWRKRAERAEALIEVQKNIAALLGTPANSECS